MEWPLPGYPPPAIGFQRTNQRKLGIPAHVQGGMLKEQSFVILIFLYDCVMPFVISDMYNIFQIYLYIANLENEHEILPRLWDL